MELFEVIQKRHSYRNAFAPGPVAREELIKIVTAGLLAPSACNKQSTRFLILDDPAMLARIAAMPDAAPCLKSTPALILCLTNTTPQAVFQGLHFELQDCAAAVENMLLAITALGYASVWIDGWLKNKGRAEQIAEWLNIPAHKTIQVILPVGIAGEPAARPVKKPFNERACFNTYALP
ncbi:MAG: nitroreductase family protein [Kiritimatiellae bacterium]|nr:nitroreductase family protein [Kiritimatiellia bacterium]